MKYEYLKEYLHPYWKGQQVFRESVLFCTDPSGVQLPARLLYPPEEICSVISATTQTEYAAQTDYLFEGGKLLCTPGSRIPCQPYAALYPSEALENHSMNRTGGGYIYFSEGPVFHHMQTLVTYRHTASWDGPVPENKSALLPRTTSLLRSGSAPKILVLGDSVTEGANSSGPIGEPPYLGSWWQLAGAYLEETFGLTIPLNSVAMGGQISSWGAAQAPEASAKYHPDLVIVAFGMNDGTHKMPPEEFRDNIRRTLDTFRADRPETEFILVGSILPNPEAVDFVGFQRENRDMLLTLEGEGVAVADVTRMHEAFLRHKAYRDMTGNNVNHLNDFSARMQAQVVLATLGVLD